MSSLSHAFLDPCLTGSEADQSISIPTVASTEPVGDSDEASDMRPTETPLEEYDPNSFSKDMERLDGMRKTLEAVKQKFNENSMKSLILNADVVTMFDPISSEELKGLVMDCNKCADRIASMQSKPINEIQKDFTSKDATHSTGDKEATDQGAFDSGPLMETFVEPSVLVTNTATEDEGSVCTFKQ